MLCILDSQDLVKPCLNLRYNIPEFLGASLDYFLYIRVEYSQVTCVYGFLYQQSKYMLAWLSKSKWKGSYTRIIWEPKPTRIKAPTIMRAYVIEVEASSGLNE